MPRVNFDTVRWEVMSQQQLDDGLNNSKAVVDSAKINKKMSEDSQLFRQKHQMILDVAYGDSPRNKIDFLRASAEAPTVIFIHGGYWMMHSKNEYTVLAEGLNKLGINVAFIDYDLTPHISFPNLVKQIHQAIDFLSHQLESFGCLNKDILVTGHSAGGHLTAMALENKYVKCGIGISGLYDLRPISKSYLNQNLALNDEMEKEYSSMLNGRDNAKPLALFVGSDELMLLRKQSADYAVHRAKLALPVYYQEVKGANHFTVLNELYKPDGVITKMASYLLS